MAANSATEWILSAVYICKQCASTVLTEIESRSAI